VPGAGWSGERLSNLQKLLGRTIRVIETRVQIIDALRDDPQKSLALPVIWFAASSGPHVPIAPDGTSSSTRSGCGFGASPRFRHANSRVA
jgi:hypothetical protein